MKTKFGIRPLLLASIVLVGSAAATTAMSEKDTSGVCDSRIQQSKELIDNQCEDGDPFCSDNSQLFAKIGLSGVSDCTPSDLRPEKIDSNARSKGSMKPINPTGESTD